MTKKAKKELPISIQEEKNALKNQEDTTIGLATSFEFDSLRNLCFPPGTCDGFNLRDVAAEIERDLAPKDSIEKMLVDQIISLHVHGLTSLKSKLREDSLLGVKLLRLMQEAVEALNRYRRKGEQRVIVQHIQVNDGGKAVVGGVVAGGGAQQ